MFAACVGQHFELYEFSSLSQIRKLPGKPPIVLYPRRVSFGEEGARVVGGSDQGCAVIYDVASGEIVQQLKYPQGGFVQAVAVGLLPTPNIFSLFAHLLDF
jgi:hypothetical protein